MGLQRGIQEDDADGMPLEARSTTPSEFDYPRHPRTISTHSSADDAELPTSPALSGSSSTIWSIPSTPGRSYSSGSFANLHAKDGSESGPVPREKESLPVSIRLMSLSNTEDREAIAVSKGKDGVIVVGLDVDGEERKMDVDV